MTIPLIDTKDPIENAFISLMFLNFYFNYLPSVIIKVKFLSSSAGIPRRDAEGCCPKLGTAYPFSFNSALVL